MPKIKTNLSTKISEIVSKYPKELDKSGNKVMCKLCLVEITFDDKHGKDNVLSHFKTKGHIKKTEKRDEQSQPFILNAFANAETVQTKNEFFADTTKMLIEANIPIGKLDDPAVRDYLTKYTKRDIPSARTVRKTYVPQNYENTLNKVRKIVGLNYIYLIVDETSDVKNRYVVNVLVGILNGEKSKPMLLSTTFINQTNCKTISQCVIDSMIKLYNGPPLYDKLWLIVTDRASYMLKAIKQLKDTFPNLNHITCIVHALHRVNLVIKNNNEVNELISLFKEIMVKSPLREHNFQNETGLPLPPKPVITRWNTWLLAAFYYDENYVKIKEFIEKLRDSSKAIKQVKVLLKSQTFTTKFVRLKGL